MTSTTFDPQKGLCAVDRLLDLLGGMAEWFKAPVLKTGDPQGSVGSNPTPSAMLIMNDLDRYVRKYSVKTRSGLAREYLFEIGAQGIKEDRLLWEDGLMVFLQFATAFGQPDVAPVGGAIGRAGKTG